MGYSINFDDVTGSELTQKDGHLISVHDYEQLSVFVTKLVADNLLTPRQTDLLKSILNLCSDLVPICTVQQIESLIDQPRDGINKTIKQLLLVNLFIEIPHTELEFDLGKIPPNTKLYRQNEKKAFNDIYSTLKEKHNKTANKRKKHMVSDHKDEALKQNNLPDIVRSNQVNRGMFPSGLPPFEKMLPNKRYSGRNHIAYVKIRDRDVIVDVKSTERIMVDDDLKTLYTLMTLSINQQANMVDYYIEKQCDPINSHYIEIRHILKALGKGSSGHYYDSFVKSILRIRGTVFNLHQLEALFSDVLGEEFFASPEFRFFQSCTPISKDGPIIVNNKNNVESVEISPFAFIIEWNSNIFKKMLTDKYFFVIPLKILSAPTHVFLLYMYLRNQFRYKKDKVITLTIDELHSRLNSSSTIYNFRRDFLQAMNTWNNQHGKLPKEGKTLIDLQGFLINIYTIDGTISQVKCRVDPQKLLANLGLSSDENGLTASGRAASPTAPNPVYNLGPLISFKDGRGDEFPSEFNMRLLLNTKHLLKGIDVTKKGKHGMTLTKDTISFTLNAYTDNAELLECAETFHTVRDNQSALFSHLQNLRSKLDLLTWRNGSESGVISQEVFKEVQDQLFNRKGIIVESEGLLNALQGQKQLIRIIGLKWSVDSESLIIEKIKDLFDRMDKTNQSEFVF